MLIIPLMSCGARLPIYALLIPAFFPSVWHAPILWIIYIIGIALAIGSAKLLRSTLLKGDSVPFVMELPPYRMPTAKGLLIHMWDRSWLYLKKAGTIILGASILMWVMTSYPKKPGFEQGYDSQLAQATTVHTLARTSLSAEALSMSQLIGARRTAFNNTIEAKGLEEGSLDYLAAETTLTAALRQLADTNPNLYALALEYHDGPLSIYDTEVRRIALARQAEGLSYSVAGRIGKAMQPLLRPMGFDWRIGTALIGAFAAKELFVSQMGIVYSVGEVDESSDLLRERLQENYTPLIAFCIMIFCLVSAPCMATIATTKRESNSWRWAMLQLGGLTALAWIVTVIIYQTGSLLGFGVT
jgi:ferrous iron transport protein B